MTGDTWPQYCLQRAFVEGAQWWDFIKWLGPRSDGDCDRAVAEAVRRYGNPQPHSDLGQLLHAVTAMTRGDAPTPEELSRLIVMLVTEAQRLRQEEADARDIRQLRESSR